MFWSEKGFVFCGPAVGEAGCYVFGWELHRFVCFSNVRANFNHFVDSNEMIIYPLRWICNPAAPEPKTPLCSQGTVGLQILRGEVFLLFNFKESFPPRFPWLVRRKIALNFIGLPAQSAENDLCYSIILLSLLC
jgi:hypothetical protein